MEGRSAMVGELHKKVSTLGSAEVSPPNTLPAEERLSSGSLSPMLHFKGMMDESKGLKAFASYIAENARQQTRMALLRSCFLGRKDQMKDALHMKHVNDELPVPFYSWEYVIVFNNPDFPSFKKTKGVTLSSAEHHFNTCFQGEVGELKYQQDVNRQFERLAFIDAFQELPESDFIEQQWKYIHFASSEEKRKARNKGGQMSLEEGDWRVVSAEPRDYLTLIRNVVQAKLSLHVGLKTRLLLSSTGEFIYMLVLADELDLQNEAERVNYFMQMELGASDLDSLEPCDTNLRPLVSVKKDGFEVILKEIKELEAEIYQEVKLTMIEENEECEM